MRKKNNYFPIVTAATYLKNYEIEVEFSNQIRKKIDLLPYLEGEIFEPLKDKKYFKKMFVDGMTISWPNGADIAPETLYADGINIK